MICIELGFIKYRKKDILHIEKERITNPPQQVTTLLKADQEERNQESMVQLESKLDQLTAEKVQDVAQEYLDENYFLGILMPETE